MDSSNVVDDSQPNKRQRLCSTNNSSDTKYDIVPIRTIRVDKVYSIMIDRVKDHFGRFGEIESVAMQVEDVFFVHFFVQFKREEDAKKALMDSKHDWSYFKAKAADPWHQPEHPLQVPPEQDSQSNIVVALNDHCVQEIFKHLKPLELTNVADVCVRFNEQAKIIFASEHKHLDLSREFHHQRESIEIAMTHFGRDIQSLYICSDFFKTEADAIRVLGQNCGPKLKRLDLSEFQFQSDLGTLRPMFARIEHLGLERVKVCSASSSFDQLMAGCGELKSLTLRWYTARQDSPIMKQTFPKLQELSLEHTHVSDETFEGFIIRHPTLTKLTIQYSHISRALRTIGQHAKNLKELIYVRNSYSGDDNDQVQDDAAFIGQLRSLKKLKIDLRSFRIIPPLKALIVGEVPIGSMDLSFVWRLSDDDAIKYISQLKRIKCLRLKLWAWDRCLTDADIIELAKNLPELEELHLDCEDNASRFMNYDCICELSAIGLRKMLMHSLKLKLLELQWIDSIKIDVDDYKAMLGTVQQRKEKAALLIKIHLYGGSQINVPATILAENRKTINIQKFRI